MILSVAWKEYREHRSFWVVLAVLTAAVVPVMAQVFAPGSPWAPMHDGLVLAVVGVVMQAGTMSLQGIVDFQQNGKIFGWGGIGLPLVITQFVGFVLFIAASQAELTQAPFDMPLAESELVAGYTMIIANTEGETEREGMILGRMLGRRQSSSAVSVKRAPCFSMAVRRMWKARSRSPSQNQSASPRLRIWEWTWKVSSTTPKPAASLKTPASRKRQASVSGQTRSPQNSRSSALFAITLRAPGLSCFSRPTASFFDMIDAAMRDIWSTVAVTSRSA